MSTQTPTDILNQAVAAVQGVAAQTVQQVANQPAVQKAAHDLGVQAGTGAREGAVGGGLDNMTVAAVGVGAVLLLGIVGYAAYKTGQGKPLLGAVFDVDGAWWTRTAHGSEAEAQRYNELMKLPKAQLVLMARGQRIPPPHGLTLTEASKDDLARSLAHRLG
jgi:hypothetical protein